jgi:TRAP-type C4-dicarboxylate transport system permease small subunit
MLQKVIDRYCQLLSIVMVACLALMVVLVFGNVVLRYAANSGIAMSEELSRWLFVWMTFLGAVVAMRDHAHLGSDMVVSRLPPWGKKVCLVVGYVLMLFICWLLFKGSLDQTRINLTTTSATMEASMAWFYSSGMVFAVSGALILLLDFWRLLTGRMRDDELVAIQESEEVTPDVQPGPENEVRSGS